MTCHDWTIYSWQWLNSLVCPLMLRTNYSCVQSLNISVDVDKFVKSFTNPHSTLTFCLLLKITCLDCTIYSWQGFNSLGCPLIRRTNYRCVQPLNISADFAKFVENFHKFTKYTQYLSVTKKWLSWTNNLFMARFQLIRMSSYATYKLQICSVTRHQCRCSQMCEKFHRFTQYSDYLSVTKNDLSSQNKLFMARF